MSESNNTPNSDLIKILLEEYEQASTYARWNLEKMYNLFNNYIMLLTMFITISISIIKFYYIQDVALSLIFLASSILLSITYAIEKHLYRLYTRFLDFVTMMICIRRKLGVTKYIMYPKEYDWLLVDCRNPYDENIPYKCKVMIIDKDHTLYNLKLIFSILKGSLYIILLITFISIIFQNIQYFQQKHVYVDVRVAEIFSPLAVGILIMLFSIWKSYVPVKEFERKCIELFNQYKVEVSKNVINKIKNMQIRDALLAERLIKNLSVVFKLSPFPAFRNVRIDQIPLVEDWGHLTESGVTYPFSYALYLDGFIIYYVVDEQNKIVKIIDIDFNHRD